MAAGDSTVLHVSRVDDVQSSQRFSSQRVADVLDRHHVDVGEVLQHDAPRRLVADLQVPCIIGYVGQREDRMEVAGSELNPAEALRHDAFVACAVVDEVRVGVQFVREEFSGVQEGVWRVEVVVVPRRLSVGILVPKQ